MVPGTGAAKANTETKPPPTTEKHAEAKQVSSEQEKLVDTLVQDAEPLELSTPPDQVDRMIDHIIEKGPSKEDESVVANRDLSSFLSFLSQRFQNSQQREDTKGKKKGKSSSKSPFSTLPTIKVKDVQKSCDSIACRVCRSAVDSHLEKTCLFQDNLQGSEESITISLSSIAANTGEKSSEEQLNTLQSLRERQLQNMNIGSVAVMDNYFDYVAMEEGILSTGAGDSDFSISLYACSGENVKDKEFQMRAPSGEDPAFFPLSLDDVHQIVRKILLPYGLNESFDEDLEKEFKLSQTDFDRVVKAVVQSEEFYSKKVTEFGQQIQELQARVAETGTTTPQTFDVTTSSTLIECDSTADLILEDMTGVLFEVTGSFHSISSFLGAVDGVKNGIYLLWQDHSVAVETTLKEVSLHEGRVMQLASRPGSVPQMFLNASHRSSLRGMLDEKLNALNNLKISFGRILLDHDPQGDAKIGRPASLVRKLYTYQAFCDVAVSRTVPDNEYKKLDEHCKSLLGAYCELTHPVRGASVSDMVASKKLRYEHLQNLTKELHKEINIASSTSLVEKNGASAEKLSGLRTEFQELMAKNELKESCKEDFHLDGVNVQERHSLEKAARNVIQQWRLVRSMLGCTLARAFSDSVPRRLPLKLRTWMDTGEPETVNASICYGGGGTRRVSCVVAGLLYRWLCDRCMEWHAELTQHELLNDMALDGVIESDESDSLVSGTLSSRPAKVGKKAKKKREKKGAFRAASEAHVEQPDVARDVSTQATLATEMKNETNARPEVLPDSNTEIPNSKSEKREINKTDQDSGPTKGEQGTRNAPKEISTSEGMSEGSTETEKAEMKKEAKLEPRGTIPEGKTLDATVPFDIPTSMGVIGRSGFQSAESYLVSRLAAVFEDSKKPGTSKTVDIIFLHS